MNRERQKIANRYLEGIQNSQVILPTIIDDVEPVWHIFGIRCKKRDELENYLNQEGVSTNKHYPIPMHLQPAYKDLNIARGELPIAEEISSTVLSLPMYYGMTDEEVKYVIDTINAFGV